MKQRIQLLLQLTKFRVAVVATLSTAAGFIVASGTVTPRIMAPVAGMLLLACGALALNEYQEREVDGIMPRTKNRPIPSGRIKPSNALAVALTLIATGSLVMWRGPGVVALTLGLSALVWYNGVYTYLKRWTAFAVVPGALIGAIPPMTGWVAGGGYVFDPAILAIAFFFFIWQVPHFWLLLFRYGRQYEQAKLCSLTSVFTKEQLMRLTFIWIVATAVSCLLIPLFGVVTSRVTLLCLLTSALWLVWSSTRLFRLRVEEATFLVFRNINSYAVWVMFLLSLDKLLRLM